MLLIVRSEFFFKESIERIRLKKVLREKTTTIFIDRFDDQIWLAR